MSKHWDSWPRTSLRKTSPKDRWNFTNKWIRIIIVWRDQGIPVWRGWVSDNRWGCVFNAGLTTIPSPVRCNWELGVCSYTRNESTIHRGNNLKQFFICIDIFRQSHFRCLMFRQGTKSRKDLWHIYLNVDWKDQIYKATQSRVEERLKYFFLKSLKYFYCCCVVHCTCIPVYYSCIYCSRWSMFYFIRLLKTCTM